MKLVRALLMGFYTMLLYLGVPLLGWGLGDVSGFLAAPQAGFLQRTVRVHK